MADDNDINMTDARVLVVDDNENNQQFILAILGFMGLTKIECAFDGAEALLKVESFNPDLILLDLMMPVMNGHEFLRILRSDPARRELPVLITSALGAQEMRNTAFDEGATDYIQKPIDRKELMARVRVHLRSHLLLASLRRYHHRLAQDLDVAREMQEALLPTPELLQTLKERHNVIVDAYFAPSAELGGDLWGVLQADDSRLGLFAVDFSGHGVAAAINTFRLHQMMRDNIANLADPAEFLQRLNAALVPALPRGQFATMVVAVLDLNTRQMTVANAGGPTPIVGMGTDIRLLPGRRLPLGITLDASYENEVLDFPPGSHLSFYSDGFTDVTDAAGEFLSEAGVLDLLSRSISDDPAETIPRFLAEFMQATTERPEDDLTFVWLKS